MRFLLPLFVLLAATPAAAQTTDSTAWIGQPEIRAIRQLYEHIGRAIDDHSLVRRDTTVECEDQGNWRADVRIWMDAQGRVRRLSVDGGGDDAVEGVEYTYDSTGHLRFALSKRGAVNGSHGEERVYWDTAGKVLHRNDRLLAGPGFPWADVEPIWQPLEWIKDPCK